MKELTEQEIVRRGKLQELRDLGLDPFGTRYDRDSYAADIKEKYANVEHDELESMDINVKVAGRIMFIRKMGKAPFISIKDKTGYYPILLLDDVLAELDDRRQNYLLKSIDENTQTIITSVDTILFEQKFLEDVTIYKVENGGISIWD